MLGEDTMKEIHAIRDVMGTTTPLIGMYGYGEFVPSGTEKNDHSVFQNESILVVALGE